MYIRLNNSQGRYLSTSYLVTPSLHNDAPSPVNARRGKESSEYFDTRVALTRSGRVDEPAKIEQKQLLRRNSSTTPDKRETKRPVSARSPHATRRQSYLGIHSPGSPYFSAEENITGSRNRRKNAWGDEKRDETDLREHRSQYKSSISQNDASSIRLTLRDIRRMQKRDTEYEKQSTKTREQTRNKETAQKESSRGGVPQWTGGRQSVPSSRLSKGSRAKRRIEEDLALLESSGFSLTLSKNR
mmetsp:Transcript_3312/g.6459  ORF Transcript_3312/g.6459 Transcript_3312/m.6459 type:complete len:243 (-) Transcript_3312:831-1559(-)